MLVVWYSYAPEHNCSLVDDQLDEKVVFAAFFSHSCDSFLFFPFPNLWFVYIATMKNAAQRDEKLDS